MRTIIYSLFSFCLIIACGAGTNNNQDTSSAKVGKQVEKSCLADMAEVPCSLLTMDDISNLSGIQSSNLKKEEPHEVVKNSKYMFCSYTWPSDRMKKIEMMGMSTEVEVDNTIQIGGVFVLTEKELSRYGGKTRIEYFEDFYTNPSEEDKKKAKEMMNKGLEENEDLTSSQKDMASKMVDMASKFKFNPVSGVGEMASWEVTQNQSGGTLIIMHGNIIFKVTVNISDDNEPNLLLAKKVAEKILEQC
jgi:hypothetical protein